MGNVLLAHNITHAFHPNASNNSGIAIPPVELTASTTTLKLALRINVAFTKGKSKISLYAFVCMSHPECKTLIH